MKDRKGLTFFELLIVLAIVLFPVVLLCVAGVSSLTKHYTKKSLGEKLAQGGKKLWDNREYLINEGQKYLQSQGKDAFAYANNAKQNLEKETKKQSKKIFGIYG